MSTSSVCQSQGLRSCLADPPVLRLKLAHPQPLPAATEGLSFLQALAAVPAAASPTKIYVHPTARRSAAALSAKSLEMCTESLGSETGSGDATMAMLSSTEKQAALPPQRARPCAGRISRSVSFPPPLASVSGSAGLRVRPHRENGRLVLKAVVVTAQVSCFHAERSDGRLRLRLCSSDAEADEAEEETGEEDGVESEVRSDEEEEEETVSEEEEEEGAEAEGVEREKSGNAGLKRGKGKVEGYKSQNQRRRRCKEDGCGKKNRVLINCNQPYMVAT